MVTADTLREAVARALCTMGCCLNPGNPDEVAHMAPFVDATWQDYSNRADAALRAIVQAAGLDAEGLEHSARFVEHHGRYSDNAAALLRALASAAQPPEAAGP